MDVLEMTNETRQLGNMNQNANRQHQYAEGRQADRHYAGPPYEGRSYEDSGYRYAESPYEGGAEYAERPYEGRRPGYAGSHYAGNARPRKSRGGVVALALAAVLAIGGAGALCVAGLGKSQAQAPVATQTAQQAKNAGDQAAQQATKNAGNQTGQTQTTKGTGNQPVQQANNSGTQTSQQTTKNAGGQSGQAQTTKSSGNQSGQAQTAQQQPAQQQASSSGSDGMEVKVSREGAIAMACEHVGANGQAQNVSARGPVTGGGTIYYVVDFDMGTTHYSVSVDVVDGHVISAEQTNAGTRQLLDENGNPQEGTEQPAEA